MRPVRAVSADLRRATATRDRLERVRRSIIAQGGRIGWLKGVTTDCLRAGVCVQRAAHELHMTKGGLL